MFNQITMIDYRRPLLDRVKARKSVGPYTWSPTEPGKGRGFYQSSRSLAMDAAGSTFELRLALANDHLPCRMRAVDSYFCDDSGDQTMVPIIARLPHGRGFLAGWTMGRGMVASLASDIHETAEDAARAAHDDAQHAAEREQEYQREHSDDDA